MSMYYVAAALLGLSGLFLLREPSRARPVRRRTCAAMAARSAIIRWSSSPGLRSPPPGACSSASSRRKPGVHGRPGLMIPMRLDGRPLTSPIPCGRRRPNCRPCRQPFADFSFDTPSACVQYLTSKASCMLILLRSGCPRFVRLSIAYPPSWKSKTPPWTGRSKRQDETIRRGYASRLTRSATASKRAPLESRNSPTIAILKTRSAAKCAPSCRCKFFCSYGARPRLGQGGPHLTLLPGRVETARQAAPQHAHPPLVPGFSERRELERR